MSRLPFLTLAALALAGCQSLSPATSARASLAAPAASNIEGVYDNHEQVWTAREQSSAVAPPHLRIGIEATPDREWSLWQIHLDAASPLDASWAEPVAFDGCSVRGQAAPGQPRPVHVVRRSASQSQGVRA